MGCISCTGLIRDAAGLNDHITLQLKEPSTIPIEADSVTPDLFAARNHSEIEALPAYYGRRKVSIGDLFTVEGERAENIVIQGDLRHVKKIGQGMRRGRIAVHGNAGPHLGAYMQGGQISVNGNAGDWAGAHMAGGYIRIKGNAGHHAGAAYPGEKHGVNRGVMIIEGNAGGELAARARRILVVVLGDAGDFAGANMIAGTIFVFGRLGSRAGAGNKRGSIVAFGKVDELLLTYRYECRFQPVFLRYYLKRMRHWGLPIAMNMADGIFRRYSGDITTIGKGEILVYDQPE